MPSEPSNPDSQSANPPCPPAGAVASAPSSVSSRAHGATFVAAWRDVVARTLRLPVDDGCIRMRGVLGGATLSYLPFLNYTDLTPADARARITRLGDRPYHVRVLDPSQTDGFAADEPVTMRLDLAGRDADAVWKRALDAKCRNQVRKAQRAQLVVRSGAEPTLVDDFHRLLAATLHHHGAPLLPKPLLTALADALDCRVYVAYAGAKPVAGLVAIGDGDLLWVPWAASARDALDLCPNHVTYWTAIEDAVAAGRTIFDFGRSPFGGNTYRFKQQWGATPVALRLLSSRPADVYAQYALAQRVWRALPRSLVDALGPRLCRHLPDY